MATLLIYGYSLLSVNINSLFTGGLLLNTIIESLVKMKQQEKF